MSILSSGKVHSHTDFDESKIEFREFDLQNGLHCILSKDARNPIVNVIVGYQVGSKDEKVNKKGISHLFEHMMFQGSANIGKTEHFTYVNKAGGNCNAFTMNDATVYYDLMPSSELEMALWLESDRMNGINITEENLSNQKKVVIEEKMQSYDNAPYGTMYYNIMRNVFKDSKYESSVIGEVDDINSFTVNEAKKFHNEYYSPSNSVLIIAGDIDYDDATEKIHKYFSDITKNGNPEREANIVCPMKSNVELTLNDNVQLPLLNICWQIPKAGSFESYCFEYFLDMLANNRSSRLYQRLVYEKKLLKSIGGIKHDLQDAGVLMFRAMINPGVSPDEIRDEILKEIKNFAQNGCSEKEFQMIRNQIEFDNYSKYLTLQTLSLETVINYLYFRNVKRIYDEVDRYLSVQMKDIVNAVADYINDKNKLTLTYLPKNFDGKF